MNKILLLAASLLCYTGLAKAQFYLGFTGDIGNRVFNDSKREPLFKRPVAPSGSISFIVNEKIRNKWFLQYGGGVGVLGYTIKAREADTLSNDPDFYDPYPNYNTTYVNGHLGFGRQFFVKRIPIYLFGGGGVTYYLDTFGSRSASSSGVWNGNSFEKVFEYEMNLMDSKVKGFIDLSFAAELTSRIVIGIRYRYHLEPILAGTYTFYHMKDPSSGPLSVTQRALSILVLFRIGKKGIVDPQFSQVIL